ncbi:MAG: Crp/Fnr family transcriptional regulator [Prochlorotrichaceae cyanobacterium]|jgi:CRP/FNR family transcriptional regulator
MPQPQPLSPLDLIPFLGETLLFAGLPEFQLLKLATLAIVQTYDKGESLFQQGDAATGFFIVQAGRIKVFKVAQDGREQILHIFGEGNHFAEVPAWDGHPYPAAAAAIEPATVVFFPRQPFLQLLEQQPDLAINLLKSFARHLRHFSNLVDTLTLHEVPTRLANYLLHLREQQGSAEQITLDLSKGQLAARLGTIPETLSRVFAKLKRQQLLAVNGNQIHLLNVEGLKQLADVDIP